MNRRRFRASGCPDTIAATVSESSVKLEVRDGVATIVLDRPPVNAISHDLVVDLAQALDRIEGDSTILTVVLRGTGRGFCAGADLQQISACTAEEAAGWGLHTAAVFDRLAALPVIVIAAMHGFALGGGFFLSLYCDYRIAAERTQLGLPPASKIWLPPWALSRLAAWVGPARAEQILLTAGMFSPEQAERWGLVNFIVPEGELIAAAHETALRLSGTPRSVVTAVRDFFNKLRGPAHSHWDLQSTDAFQRLFAAPDAQALLATYRQRTDESAMKPGD